MSSSAVSTDATPQPDSGSPKAMFADHLVAGIAAHLPLSATPVGTTLRRDDLMVTATPFTRIPTFHAT